MRLEQYKRQKYLPTFEMVHTISATNDKGKLIVLGYGPVKSNGADLPEGKNYKQYLDKKGRFNNIKFFDDYREQFPNLNTIVQREVSRRVVEVGCERFFGVSGYVSQPRRAMLGVRTYERLAMLSHMLEHIYIDPKWVAKEYQRRNKAKAWVLQKDDDSLKCFNLERILEAEEKGKDAPVDLTIQEYREGM